MNIKQFKQELRMNYRSDEWGEVMEAWFACANELRWRNEKPIPPQWRYKPAATTDPRDPENYYFDLFVECTTEALELIGAFLERMNRYLKFKEKDY